MNRRGGFTRELLIDDGAHHGVEVRPRCPSLKPAGPDGIDHAPENGVTALEVSDGSAVHDRNLGVGDEMPKGKTGMPHGFLVHIIFSYHDAVRSHHAPSPMHSSRLMFPITLLAATAVDAQLQSDSLHRQTSRGYTIGVIDSTDAVSPMPTLAHALQARLPGVSVSQGQGLLGSSSRVWLRGPSSLVVNAAPDH